MTKPTTRLSPDELLTHLHDGLAVLGLGELRRALDETLAEPTKDDSRLAWLWRLVEPQLRRRLESRAERRIREARLPVRKTFEASPSAFSPSSTKTSSWSWRPYASSHRGKLARGWLAAHPRFRMHFMRSTAPG